MLRRIVWPMMSDVFRAVKVIAMLFLLVTRLGLLVSILFTLSLLKQVPVAIVTSFMIWTLFIEVVIVVIIVRVVVAIVVVLRVVIVRRTTKIMVIFMVV